ncbi:MAG: hypothetical protein P8J27_07210 [Mariniblastus sp.]|nr:hypothetical protein [Mariniblastus sp.]
MNNWIGLLIALSLAIVAGVLNWKYLERKTEEVEMVSFLAIKEGEMVEAGKKFTEGNFTRLNIPQKSVGSLQNSAVLYKDLDTVVNVNALRNYRGGEVVMLQDLKTPPRKLSLNPGEVAFFVPVGGNSFVAKHFAPGDEVTFTLAPPRKINFNKAPAPLPETSEEKTDWNLTDNNEVEIIQGPTKFIGPFRVIAVGGRLSTYDVSRAQGGRVGQESNLGVAIKFENGQYDQKGRDLIDRVNGPGFRHAGVILNSKGKNN